MRSAKAALPAVAFLLLIVMTWSAGAERVEFPEPKGYVNDYVGVLKQVDLAKLSALLEELEKKTTAEVAVVLIETTAPLDLETYSVELAQKWGIGKRGKDNGALILVAIKDRRVRIEVGYGLEPKLTDGLCGRLIRKYFVPFFKEGRYSDGVLVGTTAVAGQIASFYGVRLTGENPARNIRRPRGIGYGCGALSILPLLIFMMLFGVFRGLFFWGLLGGLGRGGFWSGGSFGSGGFSGGFGGFGGGSFGGGGASGSW